MGFIYGLLDPRTSELKYVGKTSRTLKRRLIEHLSRKELEYPCYKSNWLKSLIKEGFKPEIFCIEECSNESLNENEMFYVAYFKFLGCKLTNLTDGGEGLQPGYIPSKEIREKISKANTGKKRTPQQIEAMRERQKIISQNPDTYMHLVEWVKVNGSPNLGRKASEETRRKQSEAKKGKKLSEEHKKKLCGKVSPRRKPIIAISLKDGSRIDIESVQHSRFHGFNPKIVVGVLKKKKKSHRGYNFIYKEAQS
jgi:group I intron endonuclease